MKKTLLASALAAMALTASAQSEVARPAGQFDFITKNLTVDGSIIPYSAVKQDGSYPHGYSDEELTFTIYDKSFNTVRSFTITAPTLEYEYDQNTLEAKAPITKKDVRGKWDLGDNKEVTDKDGNRLDSNGNPITISTLDEWKKYVAEKFGENMVIFTDAEGDFAFHENDDSWSSIEDGNYNCAILKQSYWYYNKEQNLISRCAASVIYYYNTDDLNWETVGTEKVKGSKTGEILETYLRDYDANCAEEFHPYLTQGLFNKDDKFEIAIQAYRLGTGGDGDYNTSGSAYRPVSITDDYAIFRTQTDSNNNVESYISIINEDGKEIVALPAGSKEFEMFKVDGKLYLSVEVWNGSSRGQTIIYGVDNVNTSITELARTTPVAAKKFFNTQGMQVSKDAKGIVIQKGGAKFLNK